MKKIIVLLILTLVYLAGTIAVPKIVEEGITQVDTISARKEAVELSVTVTGKVEEKSRKEIKSDLILAIKSVLVKPGDKVKEGDVLFYIDVDKSYSEIIKKTGVDSSSIPEIPKEFKAESTGTIGEVNVTSSGVYIPGSALVTLVDSNELQVRAHINEDVISKVAVGMNAVISGSGFKGHEYSGSVLQIFPTAQSQINNVSQITTVEAVLSIKNPDKYLKPGFTAKIKIITDSGDTGVVIPYEAVMQDKKNREYIYLSNGYQAKIKYIKTGRETENGVEVIDGIKEGDNIVINPNDIGDDESIRIKTMSAGGKSDD